MVENKSISKTVENKSKKVVYNMQNVKSAWFSSKEGYEIEFKNKLVVGKQEIIQKIDEEIYKRISMRNKELTKNDYQISTLNNGSGKWPMSFDTAKLVWIILEGKNNAINKSTKIWIRLKPKN